MHADPTRHPPRGARGGALPVSVRETDWADPVGERLRDALQREMLERYEPRVPEVLAMAGDAPPEAFEIAPDEVAYVGIAFEGEVPAGHVVLRRLYGDLELKRMYVVPTYRGRGAGGVLLSEAERAARALGAPRIILQTGDLQPEAVGLYEARGYTRIPIFPPYESLTFSICLEKTL